MADYAIPSSRFQRKDPTQFGGVNFYTPPRSPEYANSGVSNTGADDAGTLPAQPPQYFKPSPDTTRPGSTTKTPEQIAAEARSKSTLSGLNAADAGMQNSYVLPTTNTTSQVVNVGGNVAAGLLSGAAAGAAAGGIGAIPGAAIGGSVALITSGLNAWLGNRQARAERDHQAALLAEANRLRQEEIARDEKWRVQNRLDSLETARYQRKVAAQAQARQNMIDTANKLQAALANNASLKQNWVKYGFT